MTRDSKPDRPRRPDGPRTARGAKSANAPTQSAFEGDRIAKVLARAGVCSRREAEGYIEAGRVSVNGRKLTSPAFNVTARDRISVDGKPLAEPDPPRLWRFHKTAGLVTTTRDPQGRPTIFQKLPAGLPRLNTVGRLDINTEGLLLLTNDGGLKRLLELPSTGWQRRYRVRAFDGQKGGKNDRILEEKLAALKQGITIDDIHYRGIDATMERRVGGNVWISMALREGKNREIKRVLEHLDLQVNRLIRLSFGPFQLGQMAEGTIEEVPRRVLRQQLGKNWHALADGVPDTKPMGGDKRPGTANRSENLAGRRATDKKPDDKKTGNRQSKRKRDADNRR